MNKTELLAMVNVLFLCILFVEGCNEAITYKLAILLVSHAEEFGVHGALSVAV
jgi:hypothetical protein